MKKMFENLQRAVGDETGHVWAEVGADPWEWPSVTGSRSMGMPTEASMAQGLSVTRDKMPLGGYPSASGPRLSRTTTRAPPHHGQSVHHHCMFNLSKPSDVSTDPPVWQHPGGAMLVG